MNKKPLTLDEQLEAEQAAVNQLLEFYGQEMDFGFVVYEDWTAKDVLGHITSWHLSFMRNLESAVRKEKAQPFRGSLTEVNEREVAAMKMYSMAELIEQLKLAQRSIEANIKNEAVTEIAYKKGSRNYSPIEHLEIVRRHINGHLEDVKKKRR